MMIRTSRPDARLLTAVLDRVSRENVTYPEVGSTSAELPSGYHHVSCSIALGTSEAAFRLGREALQRWEAHRHAGAVVFPTNPPLIEGTAVIVTLRFGPAFVIAPCKIVYVTEEDDRFGFAYGTLPGHPERGEESFHIERDPDGDVTFAIRAFSRPADVLSRLIHPIARSVQRRVTNDYLEGVRIYADTV